MFVGKLGTNPEVNSSILGVTSSLEVILIVKNAKAITNTTV